MAHKLPSKLLQQLLSPHNPAAEQNAASLAASGLPSSQIKAFKSKFNASQLSAVAACCSMSNQFTLVQVRWYSAVLPTMVVSALA